MLLNTKTNNSKLQVFNRHTVNKSIEFEVEGYNYLSGSNDSPQEFLVTTDSGYYVGNQFVPFKNTKQKKMKLKK
jgi:hypothetical protein